MQDLHGKIRPGFAVLDENGILVGAVGSVARESFQLLRPLGSPVWLFGVAIEGVEGTEIQLRCGEASWTPFVRPAGA